MQASPHRQKRLRRCTRDEYPPPGSGLQFVAITNTTADLGLAGSTTEFRRQLLIGVDVRTRHTAPSSLKGIDIGTQDRAADRTRRRLRTVVRLRTQKKARAGVVVAHGIFLALCPDAIGKGKRSRTRHWCIPTYVM